jgi:hypothetical protein
MNWGALSLGAASISSQDSGGSVDCLLSGLASRCEIAKLCATRGRISSFFKEDVFSSQLPSARPRSSRVISLASSVIARTVSSTGCGNFSSGKSLRKVPYDLARHSSVAYLAR